MTPCLTASNWKQARPRHDLSESDPLASVADPLPTNPSS